MHNFLAGFLGFFVGIGTMFHGGQAVVPNVTPTQYPQHIAISGTASHSGMIRDNFPKGERSFFGTVTAVNGSILTLQMQGMRFRLMRKRNPQTTIIPTISPPTPKNLTVDLTSSTTYTGGIQTDIVINTKIAGVGTVNSSGIITALKIQINPTIAPRPSGFPHRPNQ